jgi:S1-C subfamily serine protease
MKRYWLSTAWMLACTGCLTGLAGTEAPDLETDNQERLRVLTSRLQALYENGKTARMETLIKQLARGQYPLRLEAPPATAGAPAQLYQQHKKAVVVLGGLYKCGKCSKWHVTTAAGFLLTASGIMFTNYHVFDATNKVALGGMTYDGKVYPVKEVLAASESNDVALLQLDGAGFPFLRLAATGPVGSSIWVISHPNKQFYSFTEGMVSAYSLQTRKGRKTLRMTITADFGLGSSGAPVLNEFGGVVGMVAATQPVHAHEDAEDDYTQMVVKQCVPVQALRALLGGK